jgi:hypothetical protein
MIKTSSLIIREIPKPMKMSLRKLKRRRIYSMTFSKDCRMCQDLIATTPMRIKSEGKRRA